MGNNLRYFPWLPTDSADFVTSRFETEIIQSRLGNKDIKDFIDTSAHATNLPQRKPLILLNLNIHTYEASRAQMKFR